MTQLQCITAIRKFSVTNRAVLYINEKYRLSLSLDTSWIIKIANTFELHPKQLDISTTNFLVI